MYPIKFPCPSLGLQEHWHKELMGKEILKT